MHKIFVLLVFCRCFAANTSSDIEKHVKTLHANEDPPGNVRIFEAPSENFPGLSRRSKRDANGTNKTQAMDIKLNYLNDTHKQLMVNWVGKVVVCLAKDPPPSRPTTPIGPSSVFISYDNGMTYESKDDALKLSNGTQSTLEKFYNHDVYKSHFVFTDIKNNVIFVTTDHGKTFTRHDLPFSPVNLLFHEDEPYIFAILSSDHKLYITEDFGKSFPMTHEFVKGVHWVRDAQKKLQLVVQRFVPGFDRDTNTLVYSADLFKTGINQVYMTKVKDLLIKDDYLFTTKKMENGNLNLFVSYKFGKPHACTFSTSLPLKNFVIVDVSENRAMVAVSHGPNKTNLYVSNSLEPDKGNSVGFTLSLEDVFAHFPNSSLTDIWLKKSSPEEAFADVYKVKGLSGVYVATRIVAPIENNTLSPHHVGSVITFDGGARWRLIQPPAVDFEGQSTACAPPNCSLQLSQKFQQLYPKSQPVSILSSNSAPGIIIATGVLGDSLKGHSGIYVSVDGGVSWRQILREQYFFNMGDHGGIFTAAKIFMTNGETRNVLYSLDEGQNWNQTEFHNEKVKLYGFMTEPGENTTVFTMFGSLPGEHSWLIVRINFTSVFTNGRCNESDYKMWSPSQSEENRSYIPCILGEQKTYQRRRSNAACLNGLDYVRVVSKVPCACDYLDFECDVGFTRAGGKARNSHFHCVINKNLDTKVYDPPDTCKSGEFFNRTKGYRKIAGDVCEGGFESHYLPDLVPCPLKPVDDFLLFAQREKISIFNLVTKSLEVLPVRNLRNVIAIDFDTKNNCVYWADITLDTINRQCFSNGSKAEVLVSNELSSIEGMAFDWISKTLYFVDGVRAQIELIRTDISYGGRMRRTILNKTVLKKPRGIALHPLAGYMFWTDWSQEDPSVSRANLDGSKPMKLFGKDEVSWPNGIAVDYIANRIYWVDAQRDYIGSSDLHGDGFVKVLSDAQLVSHPFAIAIFKSSMYWDDWKRNGIFSGDKDWGRNVQVVVKQLLNLMDLKAYGHGVQFGTNSCANSTCAGICVGMPKNAHSCLCPDGLVDTPDGGCKCPNGGEAYANMTCPQAQQSCSVGQFTCGTGLCISKEWRCDGEDDCGDGSDELECDRKTCPSRNHMCGDGKCLPEYWRCDYDMDCDDGSDELNCPKQNCMSNQFSCDNGRCITKTWQCDGENDCRDNSDERNCNHNKPDQCKLGEFRCHSGNMVCVPSTWQCDGQSDCTDGSDELGCDAHECAEGQFACGPPHRRCVDQSFVCDGDNDCSDGEDEANCPAATVTLPPPAVDDLFEKNGTCLELMFRCKNKRCIPLWWKCDGANDCGDLSDELGCDSETTENSMPAKPSGPVQETCDKNHFQCSDGRCIRSAWVCDGANDCPKGEDEANCDASVACKPGEIKCIIDGSCIPHSKMCDGKFDCPDHTDELCDHISNNPSEPSCSVGFFPCSGECFPLADRCDGRVDCRDGSDEANCTAASGRVYQVFYMDEDRRGRNSTALRLYWSAPPDHGVEFMPAIRKTTGGGRWWNATWMSDRLGYTFTGLKPSTEYNMTVFTRSGSGGPAVPPINYVSATTLEGVPSEPLNLTAKQKNETYVALSWLPPVEPKGVIKNYQISCVVDDAKLLRITIPGNQTSYLMSAYFQHNKTYQFFVTAFNRLYESKPSKPAELTFDGESELKPITNLSTKIKGLTLSLSWDYDGQADGFVVVLKPEKLYPKVPPLTVKKKNISISLAPGATYIAWIHAYKNTLEGPAVSAKVPMMGTKLPEINTLQVPEDASTTVKLSWKKPEDKRNVSWIYGIYYGTTQEQLFERPMFRTTNTTARISNLHPCQTYLFAVGILGPMGAGPLSENPKQVKTSLLAPPRNVQAFGVNEKSANPQMEVTWESCPMSNVTSYLLAFTEKKSNRTWTIKVKDKVSSHVFNISRGGVYSVKIRVSDSPDSKYSKPVTYVAPEIPPPIEIVVFPENNGSFFVFWQDTSPSKDSGPHKYEILVQAGDDLIESEALKFVVDKPPFVYTNTSSRTYTFAVRVKSNDGLNSMMSPLVSKRNGAIEPEPPTSMAVILVPTVLGLVGLVAVVVFLVVRHRRQNSFTRFANSHYDSRSGAATFDDSSLEEDDGPRIVGFSDDEPLVIA